jgi:endonuclease YncB( thermonuclease family)
VTSFVVIEGTFHLVGGTGAGNPSGFEPDGDSIQFKPADPALLERLDRVGRPFRLTAIGSTQLRFEGIDALELHYDGSHQPRPLADQAREFLTGELGLNPVPYRPPDDVRVAPPVARDAAPGYILSRALEANGRQVAFAFEGAAPAANGSDFFLNVPQLRKSLNYKSVAAGHAHPLFYDTLFVDLRKALAKAALGAREKKRGLWKQDRSDSGVRVSDQAELEQHGVVFPKLFRRLTEFLAEETADLAGFLAWVADKREQVLDLPANNFTHFDNVLRMQGDKVRLTRRPEEIVFVSAKTASPAVAPWLAV